MKRTIRIKLFGSISVLTEEQVWKPITELSKAGIGKKQLAFLVYLILNHDRKISASELMELFWTEDSKDPANSLKNMIHKVRTLLREIFPGEEDLLVTCAGGYEWNKDVSLDVDTNRFEALYHESKSMCSSEGLALKRNAFDLYAGEILPGTNYPWLVHLNTYYQTIYIDICKSLVMELMEQQRWDEVIFIGEKSYALAPEVEEFTICIMQALIHTGLPNQAIKHYEDYCAVLWEQFNLPPSSTVEQIHALAIHTVCNTQDTIDRLIDEISTLEEQRKAFQCSQMVFQNFVQMELRQMIRNRNESSLVALKLDAYDQSAPSSTNIRRVERVLQTSLRAGDPFTRLNQGTFLLLLANASEENSHKVIQRIQKNFYSTYPRSNTTLNYRIYPLHVQQDAGGQPSEA